MGKVERKFCMHGCQEVEKKRLEGAERKEVNP